MVPDGQIGVAVFALEGVLVGTSQFLLHACVCTRAHMPQFFIRRQIQGLDRNVFV